MNLTLLQYRIAFENPELNIATIERLLNLVENPDLIVLPEMFTTGFSMNTAQYAENMNGKSVNWMVQKAALLNTTIIGSLIIEENGKYYNRLVAAHSNGNIQYYNKRHLFRMGEENNHYTAGNNRIILDIAGFRICPLICYDLRFPVWSRNTDNFDMLVYVANWPSVRADVWNTLLKARAIENQCYVAGVNCTGTDGNNILYKGESQIINAKGQYIRNPETRDECVISTTLSISKLQDFRKQFPVLLDRDSFNIIA